MCFLTARTRQATQDLRHSALAVPRRRGQAQTENTALPPGRSAGRGPFSTAFALLPWLMLACFACLANRSLAGSGGVVTAPMAGVKPKSKLTMVVDPMWVEGNGYRPVRIKLANVPAVPVTADRNFTIEVSPGNWYLNGEQLKVQGKLTIPQGSIIAETTISVPYSGQWNQITVDVFEDGSRLRDMKLETSLNTPAAGQPFEVIPNFLVIDEHAPTRDQRARINFNLAIGPNRQAATYDLPDLRALAALNPYSNAVVYGTGQIDDLTVLQSLGNMPSVELLPPGDLPDKWLDYTCFDVVITSHGELAALQTAHPKRFDALRDWVAAGGSLVVFGFDAQFANLKQLEKLLSMPPADPRSKWGPARDWVAPSRGSFSPAFRIFEDGSFYGRTTMPQYGPGLALTPGQAVPPGFKLDELGNVVPDPTYNPSSLAASLPEVRLRPLQMGRVAAVGVADLFPGNANQWNWIGHCLGRANLAWYQRHGVSLVNDNHDYWNFHIPGVGMAPVTGFRVLISLFVVLIGPVNYLLLRRWKRLYLLLVTVPGGAAAVTICLLGYALVTDGLGVRARVRSYTHLDQRGGSAVSWSRQSYYAGLAPSQGMNFPEDAAVYRIVDNRFDSSPTNKFMVWNERRQILRTGFLNSRSMAQFLVVRSHHKTPSRIEVSEPEDGKSPPQITNLLGTKIQCLVLCDTQGQWHEAEDLAPGQSVRLVQRPSNESFTKLRKLAAANPLVEPPGTNAYSYNYYGPRWGRRRSYYYNSLRWGNTQVSPTVSSSLLETELRMATAGGAAPLAPRSYVAIVDRSPETPLGIESAREEASLHVVVGQW